MTDPYQVIDNTTVQHRAFVDATDELEKSFAISTGNHAGRSFSLIGESGTGKTSVLDNFIRTHSPSRNRGGLIVPVLKTTAPVFPSVKMLCAAMLRDMGVEDHGKGTEHVLSSRLKVLIKNSQTRMIIIDEFQHFYDRGTKRIMRSTADWLKVLIDDTKTSLVVAGLPTSLLVIDENEQLYRRLLVAKHLPRFRYEDALLRNDFLAILETLGGNIDRFYKIPRLDSDDMGFRIYCATGGLFGNITKLLREAVFNAHFEGRKSITLAHLDEAYNCSLRGTEGHTLSPGPFDPNFTPLPTVDLLNQASLIGKPVDVVRPLTKQTKSARGITLNSMMVTS